MFFLPLKSICIHSGETEDRRLSRRLFLQLAVQVSNVVFPWDDDDDDNGTRSCSLRRRTLGASPTPRRSWQPAGGRFIVIILRRRGRFLLAIVFTAPSRVSAAFNI
jgi:hypothetical protein